MTCKTPSKPQLLCSTFLLSPGICSLLYLCLYSTLPLLYLYPTLLYFTQVPTSTLLYSALLYSTLSTQLYSALPFSTSTPASTLPPPYLYSTSSLLHGANWTQRELDTMIFELVRTLLHDLIRHMPTGHNDL